MQDGIDIRQIKGIIRRRRKSFFFTFIPLLVVGAAVAFVLPPLFLSKSTILIEGQQIPPEYVRTTITSFVEERLQIITQRIMSRGRLLEVIDRFNLYADMKEKYTTEEIIEKMRKDIKFKTISAEVKDRRTGQASVATIAFTLSYEGKSPGTVQKVANVLTSLYLEENLKTREQRASNTTEFLQQEIGELKKQMDTLQNTISEFKKAHIGELPEYTTVNLQAISRLTGELDQVRMQINMLKERKILLEGQLATVEPYTSFMTEEGKATMDPRERLKFLRLQLLSIQATSSAKHPDVIRLRKEIQELEKQVGDADPGEEREMRLAELTTRLAEVKGALEPRHPDVVKLEKEIEMLRLEQEQEGASIPESNGAVTEKPKRNKRSFGEMKPDNPAYINMRTQVESADLEIAALVEQDKDIRKEIVKYEKRIEQAPAVEKEYVVLLRDYENAKAKHNELTSKYLEAKVALGMEETQRGERFTIIDPAQLPEKPHKPNRLAIVVITLVLSLGAGVGLAAIREVSDGSLKSADELSRLTGIPVLSVVSLMTSPEERRTRRIRYAAAAFASIGVIVVGLMVMDHFVMPLDVFWAKVQRKAAKVSVM